jgi:beta-glucanase (GH16 family)
MGRRDGGVLPRVSAASASAGGGRGAGRARRHARGRLVLAVVVVIVGLVVAVLSWLHSRPVGPGAYPGPEGAPGRAGTWRLAFADDFNGGHLDTNKWTTAFPWGPHSDTTPNAVYRRGNVTVADGMVRLRADPDPAGEKPFTSGMISTGGADGGRPTFAFTYGFMEIRAQLPDAHRAWPAFWTLSADGDWPPEIDVMENFGHEPNRHDMHFHYLDPKGTIRDDGAVWEGPDFTSGFHTFGVSWAPDAIRWYVDGVQRRAPFIQRQFIPSRPMYLLANLQVGGRQPGKYAGVAGAPSTLTIDYIRVWSRAGS